MKTAKLFLSVIAMSGVFGVSAVPALAKDGVLSKVQASQNNYCHMHFPAMDERTLSSNQPVLKDASSGDIIHFYGPCDYDPHGKEAVQAQRRDESRRLNREYAGD